MAQLHKKVLCPLQTPNSKLNTEFESHVLLLLAHTAPAVIKHELNQ